MKISISIDKGQVIVELSGNVYAEEAAMIREEMLSYIDKGHTKFIIRLTHVEYIDSSGLGVLVTMHKKILQKQGVLTLQGVNGEVKDLLELTRLNQVFNIQ